MLLICAKLVSYNFFVWLKGNLLIWLLTVVIVLNPPNYHYGQNFQAKCLA